jgi:DNA mismatch repair ATPase MutS
MVLDSNALENLEIFEVNSGERNHKNGSLIHHLDYTSTPFG